MQKFLTALGVLILTLALDAHGPRLEAAEESTEVRLAAVVDDGFWGAVFVRRDGEVLLSRGYGTADLDTRPIDEESLFDIASASKQFTAAAVLKLQMQGKLSVEDRLAEHVEGVPTDKRGITLYDLLTHTSGLEIDIAWEAPELVKRDEMVARVLREPLRSEPGTTFEYSNVGYFLLAAVIEAVSGASFESYLKKHLFRPAGMKSTGFVRDRSLRRSRETARVFGNTRGTVLEYPWNWANRGATGVVTTLTDLARWDEALRGTKVLDEEAKAVLFRPRKALYACGWRIGTSLRGTTKQHHGGTTRGYRAEFQRFPSERALIVVLTNNAHDPGEIAGRLEAALFGSERPTGDANRAVLGRYGLPGGGYFEVAHTPQGLVVRAEGTEACCRMFYGLERLPDWPHLFDQMEVAGRHTFERLAMGGEKAARELLPAPAAFLASWNTLTRSHGAFSGFDVIGSNSGRAMNTYVRARFGEEPVVFLLLWGRGRNLASVQAIAGIHPYEIAITPLEEDHAFAGRSLFGGRRVGLEFDISSAEPAVSLTWEDETKKPRGRIVCPRLD